MSWHIQYYLDWCILCLCHVDSRLITIVSSRHKSCHRMSRKLCITSKDLYSHYSTIYELKNNKMVLAKKHYYLPAVATSTTDLPYEIKDMLPFIFRLSLETIIRSCIVDGRYKDLASVAFVNCESLEKVYDRVYLVQFRKDKLATRLGFILESQPRYLQNIQITRLSRTLKFLDTLIEWFLGNEEYGGALETDEFVYFKIRADPNPSWKRQFEPWEYTADFDVELNTSLPVFETHMSYKQVITGDRFGDRAIISGQQIDGIVQTDYYRNPVITIKVVDKFDNCQGTKAIYQYSDNWRAISCLLRACLGRDAGIYFIIDSSSPDVVLAFTVLNEEGILFEHDTSRIMRSSAYKNMIK